MAMYHRVGFTAAQSAELWERWKKGEGLKSIGRAFGKPSSCIFAHLRPSGGIMPPARRRSRLALTMAEREEISRGIVEGQSVRAIARMLARAASTVSREISRNGGIGRYRAAAADKLAWKQAVRPKPCKLAMHGQLRQAVVRKLELNWSPEQIAGWLKRAYPETEAWRVSHETIYRSLYLQTRGVLHRELVARLRSKRTMRRGKRSSTDGQRRGQIIDAVSIRDRLSEIDTRATPGHWEGDLITGARNTHIATLVERYSRYLLLVRVNGKDTTNVVGALIQKVKQLPRGLLLSLTWDRGTELAMHKLFSRETGVPVYFCDPKSPWQRGTNENTNGLLRQYFPSGLALSTYSQHDLDVIALRLNSRPRKTLGFLSPRARITGAVAATR